MDNGPTVEAVNLVGLVVALWRVQRRAARPDAASEAVQVACESALDRVTDLGFRLDEMLDQPYHENMRVRVVEQIGDRNLRISECLAPAVYYQDELLRPAEVVVTGENSPMN